MSTPFIRAALCGSGLVHEASLLRLRQFGIHKHNVSICCIVFWSFRSGYVNAACIIPLSSMSRKARVTYDLRSSLKPPASLNPLSGHQS